MALRITLCAHCRSLPAVQTCGWCGSAVCDRCVGDASTCPVPRTRVLRLGLGRRLRRVDPEGRVGLVSAPGWKHHQVLDLAAGAPIASPCRVPLDKPAWVPAIAREGRVIWRHPGARGFGVMLASVYQGPIGVFEARKPAEPRELCLCPAGRHAWFRTRAETVQVWNLRTGVQHEYTPFPAATLQATDLDDARGVLASSTHGRVNLLRLEGGRVTLLGLLHLRNVDNPWIALAETCVAVICDLGGRLGYVLRVFAVDADGVPESMPFHVVPEVLSRFPRKQQEMQAGGMPERRLQRPIVASLSRDGRYLALAMRNRSIAVHDLQRGRAQHLDGHTDRIAMLSFSAGARALISSDHDNRVIIWPRRDEAFLDLAPDQRA